MKVRVARFSVSIWRNVYKQKLTLACKRLINSLLMAWLDESTEIRDSRAYNLLLKCLRGKSQVSLSAHGTAVHLQAPLIACVNMPP